MHDGPSVGRRWMQAARARGAVLPLHHANHGFVCMADGPDLAPGTCSTRSRPRMMRWWRRGPTARSAPCCRTVQCCTPAAATSRCACSQTRRAHPSPPCSRGFLGGFAIMGAISQRAQRVGPAPAATHDGALRCADTPACLPAVPAHGGELHDARAQRLLRQRHLPPHHQGVHGPDRRPARCAQCLSAHPQGAHRFKSRAIWSAFEIFSPAPEYFGPHVLLRSVCAGNRHVRVVCIQIGLYPIVRAVCAAL